jgi:hypothetical protein
MAFGSQSENLVEHSAERFHIAHPEYVTFFADERLEVDLDWTVFTEVTHEVGQGAVVLFHDRRYDNDADTGIGALFLFDQILNAFECAVGALGGGRRNSFSSGPVDSSETLMVKRL